jgi:hypothetical protein
MDVLQTTIASMATFYPDAGAQDPNSAYTQSALTKIIVYLMITGTIYSSYGLFSLLWTVDL